MSTVRWHWVPRKLESFAEFGIEWTTLKDPEGNVFDIGRKKQTEESEIDRMTAPLTEPAEAPSERQGLEEFLDYYRRVLRRKVEGLDSADLNRRVGASPLTLGGIIKHLSLVEESWFVEDILGQELSEPWATLTGKPILTGTSERYR